MADPQNKLVQVNGLGLVEFPGSMPDEHVSIAIRNFRAKKKADTLQTESSERQRQLKPAQPLSSAIPKLPEWANTPLVSGPDQPSVEAISPDTTQEQSANARLQKAVHPAASWLAAHPKAKATADVAAGTAQGVGNFAKGMTSPANIALMLTAPQSKLLSAYFAIQAAKGH